MLELTIGAILAGLLVVALHHARFEDVLRFWAVALSVAAAIYPGLVLVGGASAPWFLVEAAGLLLFSVLALLGLKDSPWVLALAWLAHAAWDTGLHSRNPFFVPQWYPALCAGFDIVVAGYLLVMFPRSPDPVTSYRGAPGAPPRTRRRP